ncbi:MAG: DUF2804 family protein [Solirubrobacterales bacterium]|nr:DUF2804 family protein [Solirubrobacterales bacterium]
MEQKLAHLPYRGTFGTERPRAVAHLPLPPRPMPARDGLRPLKAWRYVGAYSPDIMLCLGSVRVGPLRQSFWALWDGDRLREHTLIGRREVRLSLGHAAVHTDRVRIELALDEGPGVETVSRTGDSYAWTRKQGSVRVRGQVSLDGRRRELEARAIIDDSAGYSERHTSWRWCAGVGRGVDGRELAWNLVEGVHDAPQSSERTLWVDGVAHEAPPSAWDGLRFQAEAERSRRDNLLIIRSTYRQPFGTFSGEVAGFALAEGYGVTEDHEAWW